MTTVYDVPAKDLIDVVAKKLHEEKSIVPPEGCSYWRTGINKENPPENKDWWYTRCASVLRKLYLTDGIGIEHLRAEYGGNRDRRTKPNRVRKGSGAIVRRTLQQLEKAGYVTKVRGKGRILTPKGKSFLDKTSYEVLQSIRENYSGLKKY